MNKAGSDLLWEFLNDFYEAKDDHERAIVRARLVGFIDALVALVQYEAEEEEYDTE